MTHQISHLQVTENESAVIAAVVTRRVMGKETVKEFGQELLKLAKTPDRRPVIVDLQEVAFLSSAALQKFIILNDRLRIQKRQLSLRNLCPNVREVFDITGLDRIIAITDNVGTGE